MRAALDTHRPLGASETARLMMQATALLLAYYAVSFLSLLLILVFLCVLVVVFIGAARFGVSGFLKAPLAALDGLIKLIARSLNIQRSPVYAVPLRREQAPGLFALIEGSARQVGVEMPQSVLLEMSDNAWVRLRGYRAGRGYCTLGIGYDLLALLTQAELAAVLAHEMAHARLVQRGYRGWLSNGMTRLIQFAHALGGLTGPGHHRRFYTAELLQKIVSALAKSGARTVAALSRQDEFAADGLAARLCGAETYARALMTLALSGAGGRDVTWRDRLVQWQREGTLTEWLRRTLLPDDTAERAALEARAVDSTQRSEWSTHPTLSDRLAHLPATANTEYSGASVAPAVSLLANPDATAAALLVELERLADKEEKQESDRLRRAIRKERTRRKHTVGETVGMAVIAVGACGVLMTGVLAFTTATDTAPGAGAAWVTVGEILGGAVAVIGLGAFLRHVWRHRDRMLLPIPGFARWEEALAARELSPDGVAALDRQRHELTTTLRAQKPSLVTGRGETARYWARQAYDALGVCDYARANAAAQLCLEAQPKNLEGNVARGVAAAFTQDGHTLNQTLGVAAHDWGVGPSLSWALGWGLTMLGYWERAEAYLHDALARREGTGAATLWALLAVCQWQQGKMYEAAESARRAAANPLDLAARVLLIRILVAAGRPQDAARELTTLEAAGPLRGEQPQSAAVSVYLLLGRDSEAARYADLLERDAPGAKTLLRLAHLYGDADHSYPHQVYLERVCALGFHPQALVGLARLAHHRGENEAARSHLLAALDMTRLPAPDGEPQTAIMETALRGLAAMNGEAVPCEEWTADVSLSDASAPASPTNGTSHLSLSVAAPSLREAKTYAAELYSALRPGRHLEDVLVEWKPGAPLPVDSKPIPPGVYDCRFS